MPLSALIGGILGGPLIESIGRRTTILSTALPFTICEYFIVYSSCVCVCFETFFQTKLSRMLLKSFIASIIKLFTK